MKPKLRIAMAAVGLMAFSTFLTIAPAALAETSDSQVLENMTIQGIDSHWNDAITTAQALEAAVKHLCSEHSDQSLTAARASWKNAWVAWNKTLPYLIGPAGHMADRIGKPCNATVLEAVVASNEFAGMRQGNDVRGYTAVEYLLFASQDSQEAVANERCLHLTDITAEITARLTRAKTQWDQDYREAFLNAGNGQPYLNPNEALSQVVAQTMNIIEDTVRERIGFPTNFNNGPARPDLLDAPYSKTSLEGLQAIAQGVASVMIGDGTHGLLNLLATRDGIAHEKDPGLAKDIRKQIQRLDKNLEKLKNKKEPLYTVIKKKPSALKGVYKDMSKLEDMIAEAAMTLELDVKKGLEAQMLRQ
nr:imelysin family protein [uncultured Desulfobacter sp.]